MKDKWALNLTNFAYNGENLLEDSDLQMNGIIDTRNGDIQVPTNIYDNLLIEMRSHDRSIYSRNIQGRDILLSRKACKNLFDEFKDLVFQFDDIVISIPAQGYLYEIPGQEHGCFIGISKLEFEDNEIRLGTLFLKHFNFHLKLLTKQIMLTPKENTLAKITGS